MDKELAQSIIDEIMKGITAFEEVSIKIRDIEDKETRDSIARTLSEIINKAGFNALGAVLYHHPDLDPYNLDNPYHRLSEDD